eukprot:6956150-Prymnesium_polylepis.1
MWPREGWGRTLSFGTSRAAVGARMATLLNGSTYVCQRCAPCAYPVGGGPAYPISSQRERHGLSRPLGRWR